MMVYPRMTETEVDAMMKMWKWEWIPAHMHSGVKNWVKYGVPGGGFLTKMLEHDIYNAAGKADLDNQAALMGWIRFMYNELPGACHGSRQACDEWYAGGGLCGPERNVA